MTSQINGSWDRKFCAKVRTEEKQRNIIRNFIIFYLIKKLFMMLWMSHAPDYDNWTICWQRIKVQHGGFLEEVNDAFEEILIQTTYFELNFGK